MKITTGMIATLVLAIALGFSTPVSARGNNSHHGGGHHGGGHHNYGHSGHHYSYGHHYSGRHNYGYLATGLILGASFSNYYRQPPYVERRTVIYRTPDYAQPVALPVAQPAPRGVSAPVERPNYYLRKDRNGECWLVESTDDGEQIITPQSADVCG